jgi:general stress protein 26
MDEHEARVWDLLEMTGVGMLTTRFAQGMRARPMEPRPDRDGCAVYFITDLRGLKDDEIEAAPEVCLTLTNHKDKAYLSLTARATVLRDAVLAAKYWQSTDDVWWPSGPEDENVRVLRLELLRAELWDGPASSTVAAFELAKARMTGAKPDLGENRKVTVEMGGRAARNP